MIIGSGVTIGSNITIGDLPVVIYTPQTALYTFTTFTFQTANIVGPTGPTAAQLFGNTYSNVGNTWLTNTSYFNATSTGYQYWTVPQDGNYQIVAAGARAGITTYTANLTSANLYGRGATISGTFALSQGQILAIAVGQPSANTTSSSYTSAGGGGGTFVVLGNTFPLVVAGGGGGVGFYNTIPLFGANAATAANGVSSYNGAPGGVLGQGGNTHINAAGTVSNNLYDSGAGGGFSGNGAGGGSNTTRPGTVAASTSYGQGGLGFAYGLIGGSYSTTYAPPVTSSGGFGGGGGAGPITGGGGGGYSGGGGAYASSQPIVDGGGAGGSWVAANATAIATHTGTFNGSSTFNGLTVTTVGTLNAGAGYVTITKV